MRRRHTGFSMVELMVGVVIAILVVIIVMQALAVFEAQRRRTSGGSDSSINGALALFQIERDLRMTGYGLMAPTGMLCPLGINIYYNGTTVSDGATGSGLVPIVITDGVSGAPDQIRIVRSDSAYGIAPTTIVKNMPNASSIVTADGTAGLTQGSYFIVGDANGSKVCTLMQASMDPQQTGNGWNLQHNPSYLWNPPNPNNVFTTAPSYVIGDVVTSMGSLQLSTYAIQCDDNATPSATNRCDLIQYNPVTVGAPINWTNANVNHLARGIVNLQAQYGIAAAGDTSGTVVSWVDATGPTWAAPSAADVLRIKALRVAIVTRSSTYDKAVVSPPTLTLWPATASPAGTQQTMALSAAQQHYRYQILYQVIPLINMIWANV